MIAGSKLMSIIAVILCRVDYVYGKNQPYIYIYIRAFFIYRRNSSLITHGNVVALFAISSSYQVAIICYAYKLMAIIVVYYIMIVTKKNIISIMLIRSSLILRSVIIQ